MISLLIVAHLLFFADFFGRFEKYLYLCHDKIWESMKLFAWYYFHAKRPRSYVKAMATRQLNKRLAA